MKKVLSLITIILMLSFVVACQSTNIDPPNNKYDDALINILNDNVIYYDELINGEFDIELEVKNGENSGLIHIIDQTMDYVRVEGNKIIVSQEVTKNYTFILTTILEENKSVYDSMTFLVNPTRGVIVGERQISQIVVSANGDLDNSRGVSWFTSGDIEDTILHLSKDEDFSSFDKITGVRQEFEAYVFSTDPYNGIPREKFYNHQVDLVDLDEDTIYYYRVGSEKIDLFSKPQSFKTTKKNAPIRFFLTTDVHVGGNEKAEANSRFYHAALQDAKNRYGSLDLAINTGDFVTQWYRPYDYNETEWAAGMNLSPLLKEMTFIPVAGNHDSRNGFYEYRNVFPKHYNIPNSPELIDDGHIYGPNYSFNAGNTHFTILNYHDSNSPVSQEQLDWLDYDLGNHDKTWTIVFSHIILPIEVQKIIDKHNVTVAYSGHEHVYRRTVPLFDNQPQTMEYGGENNNFLINQKGTMYVVNSTTGGASEWRPYEEKDNEIIGYGRGSQVLGETLVNRWGIYSVVTALDNKLQIDVYVRKGTSALDDFHLLETYGFIRE